MSCLVDGSKRSRCVVHQKDSDTRPQEWQVESPAMPRRTLRTSKPFAKFPLAVDDRNIIPTVRSKKEGVFELQSVVLLRSMYSLRFTSVHRRPPFSALDVQSIKPRR